MAAPHRRPALYGFSVLLAAAAAGAAAASAAVGGGRPVDGEPLLALGGLAVLLVAAEYLFVRFRYRGQVDALNLVEAVLAPLLVAFPGPVVVATVALAQAASALLRRNEPVKGLFNVAQWSCAAGVGALVYAAVAGPGSGLASTVGAVLLALATVGVVNQAAFTTAIMLATPQPPRAVLAGLGPAMLPGWLLGWVVNSLVGLLFVLAYHATPAAVPLFLVPLAILHLAYKGWAGVRSDRRRLAGLHQAARALSEPLDPRQAVGPFLVEVARCFEARAAELVLAEDGGRVVHRATGDGENTELWFEPDGRPSLEGALLHHPQPLRLAAGGRGALPAALATAGWRDCLAAPLYDGGRITGALLVLDQAGLEGFESGELAVVEALARETAATFAKGRLLETIIEERRTLSEIVETTSDGILTIDDQGVVRSWNRALERITGIGTEQAVGHTGVLSAVRPRTVAGLPVDLERWWAGATLPGEIRIHTPSGPRRLSCSYSRSSGDGGQTLVVVARDVTPVDEIEELRARFGQLAAAEAAQRAVVEHLQQAVLPSPVAVDGLEVGVAYVASDPWAPTGGDLYDWQVLPAGDIHLAVVDVLGHGVAATKDALAVVHALRTLSLQGCPLTEIVARADGLVQAQNPDLVATVVVVRYEPTTGRLRIAGGGHPPPLVVSPAGEVRRVHAPGTAIGWPGAGSDEVTELTLTPGDSLVLYTDGLVEARKNLVEGLDALGGHAAALAGRPAPDLARQLVARALEGAERHDDSVAVVVSRLPQAAAAAVGCWVGGPEGAEVRRLRRELAGWLASVGVPDQVADAAVVAANELLSNAVRAARTAVELRATWNNGEVRVEVEDDGPGSDVDLSRSGADVPSLSAEHGRGLFVVRALTEEVEALTGPEGTIVRCVVRSGLVAGDQVAPPAVPAR